MTQEKIFPRVFEPQSIREFSTVCYQALYENNDEAKKYLQIVEVNYCSPNSTLGENENAYMQKYMCKAFHLAKKMKKANRRNLIRKERTDFNKKISLEEATINKNRYLRASEEIKNGELEKIKSVFGRAAQALPPLTSSASFAISYVYFNVPKESSALIAGITGASTYAAFKILCSRKTKKAIQDCCEVECQADKYYTERLRQTEEEYSDDLLKIEDDKESEENKYVSREIRDLKKYWRFYGVGNEKTGFYNFKGAELIVL